MELLNALDSIGTVGMTIAGTDATVIFTVVAALAMGLSALFFAAVALAPHLSSDWATQFRGAIPEVETADSREADHSA